MVHWLTTCVVIYEPDRKYYHEVWRVFAPIWYPVVKTVGGIRGLIERVQKK